MRDLERVRKRDLFFEREGFIKEERERKREREKRERMRERPSKRDKYIDVLRERGIEMGR